MNTRNSLVTGITGCHAAPSRWLQLLAVAALVAIAGCEPPEERVANYVASAEQFFEEENLVKAELEAKNALQIEPKNADARYILAHIAVAKREFNNVVGNLLIAIESRPEFIEARTELGTLYVQAGMLELAEEQLVELEKFAPEHTETRLLRARLLANKGELEQAAVELKAAISAEPDNIVAMGLLASLLAATDVDEALVIVDEAIARSEESRGLWLLKINILTGAARSEAVEAAYRSLISHFPDEFEYRFRLAKFLAEEGKIEDVADVLMAAVDHDPSDQEAKLTLVRFVAATQSVKQGVALLQDFLEQDPAATELRMLLADQYLKDGDTESAKVEFQKIADTEENEDAGLTARMRIASIAISEGELEAGTAIVEDVLARDPLNANANYLKGTLNFLDANWKGAVANLRNALRQDPNNLRSQWLLARTHFRAGDLLLAEEAYRKLIQNSPINVAASLELARLLVDLKRLENAEEFLSRQIALMPLEVDLSRAMIGILVELERYDDAIAEAERFGATEGNEAVGNYFVGGIYQARGQLDKASDAFRDALEDRPDAREPLQALVSSLAAQDRIDEARDYLQDLTQQYPENLFIKTLLGQVMAVTGDKDAAREIFETTLSNQSAWLPAYAALASLDSGDPQAQIDVYRRGLQASPGNQRMTMLLGSAYERRGEIEKAITLYETALGGNPNMPLVANNLAALLSDYRQDRASFNRALEVARPLVGKDEALLLDTLGWIYYRLGDYQKAQRLLERSVELEPNFAVLRYHLGMTYRAQNKEQLSIEQLRAATEVPEIEYLGREEAEQALAELLGTN
jgi:tetratricopeptide (TPR) repeat protein